MNPIVVTINGAAETLSMSRSTIYNLIRDQKLETVKIGRRTFVRTESIRALAQAA